METVKLTASFKLDRDIPNIFSLYKRIINELLDYASSRNVSSFKMLKKEKYYELRQKYSDLLSHYIYTACQIACPIYKSFRKLKRKSKTKGEKPVFKRDVIMLDDHLFSPNLEGWTVSIAIPNGRIKLKLLRGKYHEKFKDWRIGQAWLIKKSNGLFSNVVFSKKVKLKEVRTVIGVERIQSKIITGKTKRRLLSKYGKREVRRILDIYHKVANWIIEEAMKSNSAIALENLKNIRGKIRFSSEMNGRLHRWSFRKLQSNIEYKAKLQGIKVIYVNARGTSSLCPICGAKLSLNGHRMLKCKKCSLIADRDVIGAWNIRLRDLEKIDVQSSVPRESFPMKPEGRRLTATNIIKCSKSSGESEWVRYMERLNFSVKAVLFDLDGTLINLPNGKFFDDLLIQTLSMLGLNIPSEEERFSLWSSGKKIEEILKSWGVKNVDELWKIFDELDLKKRIELINAGVIRPFDDVKPTLEQLKAKGFKLGIVTNTPSEIALLELETFDLKRFFDNLVMLGTVEQAKAKPEPDGILWCLSALNMKPREAVYVGDSFEDILAGKRAGVCTVLIKRKDLKLSIDPDFEIDSLLLLLELLNLT